MRTALLLLPALVAALIGAPGHAGAQDRDPHCPAPEARAFDFWIGSWDVLNRNRPPDGNRFYETGRATDRVYPVVGGCGIVEHWRGRAISRFIVGFSIRAYDPAADEWLIVLLWPTTGQPAFGELRGGFRHGRGEFSFRRVGPAGDTVINRFAFSDIGPHSLRWANATSRDGGRSWIGNWIMEFTRRSGPAAAGLWNGPTMTTRRCPDAEHRRFDRLLGEWAGVRTAVAGPGAAGTGAAADTVPVTVSVVRILEGCAVMERVRGADGGWEAFRVRAYEPAEGRWVEYALDSERKHLVRREAVSGAEIVFSDVDPPDGVPTRTRWRLEGEDGPGWVVERADGPDGSWRPAATVRLDEPLGTPFRP